MTSHMSGSAHDAPASRPYVLLVTEDPGLVDEVVDIAATVGIEVRTAGSAGAAAACQGDPVLRLVGEDVLTGSSPVRGVRCVAVCRAEGGLDDPPSHVWRGAVAWGAEHVVVLPPGAAWLAGRLAEAAEPPGASAAVLGVVPGHGGAGASTLAASLALNAASSGAGVALLDCDPAAGGIDLLIGDSLPAGLRWADIGDSATVSGRALADSVPRVGGVAVLTGERGVAGQPAPGPVAAAVAAARRSFDLVVVDCPSWAPEIPAYGGLCDEIVLVAACDVRAAAAASARCAALRTIGVGKSLVVRGPGPSGLTPEDIAGALDLPLSGYVVSDRVVARAADRGRLGRASGRGSLGEVTRVLLGRLVERPAA